MKIIEPIEKELQRIGASSIVCNKLLGEPQYQLLDEQWESNFIFNDKLLEILYDLIDGAGPNAVWDYLKSIHIQLMLAPQTERWRECLRLARLKKRNNF